MLLRFRAVAAIGSWTARCVPSVAIGFGVLPEVLSEKRYSSFSAHSNKSRDHPSAPRDGALSSQILGCAQRSRTTALSDIDWRAGTIRLAANKSRRVDVLPLPTETGRAIAEYLRRSAADS